MKPLVFDIETAPLPDDQLAAMLPPFDPAAVKVGNIKDPAKIAEKIAEAEANHAFDFKDKAALSATTGRVLAIGCQLDGEPSILHNEDERDLLHDFWGATLADHQRFVPIVGFNTHLFDLPFLIRRGWKYGINPPAGLRKGRYFSEIRSIDLRDEWQLGDRMAHGSLDAVSRHLGLGNKTGSGKDFATLWRTNQGAARAYLVNDVELTAAVARVLRPDLFV